MSNRVERRSRPTAGFYKAVINCVAPPWLVLREEVRTAKIAAVTRAVPAAERDTIPPWDPDAYQRLIDSTR
jgi:hypothetical protein